MNDLQILRELAREYAVYALDGRSAKRKEQYRAHNALEILRPPVLVFEVPWGEYADNAELALKTQDSRARAMESELRRAIFQFKYFEGDYALHDYYRCPVVLHDSGNGLHCDENILKASTGTNIMAHQYLDIIPDRDAFLSQIKTPVITYDKEATASCLSFADDVFHDIMPVKKAGIGLYMASWDQIPRFHGIENSLMDLYDDPDYAHLLISRFTDNHIATMKQYEELNVLDTDPLYLHCTPAATRELPVKDIDRDNITLKDVWARCMAQIFAVVSPEMHDEFDLQYTKKLFDLCGLSYYGCCEPLHDKIEKLKKFENLRRISITAWANVDVAAEKMGGDYILSYKPNPAFVAMPDFDPAPVESEVRHVLEACKRNGTPCEFILKDISTTASNYTNLSKWVNCVNRVIDEYFPR